METDTDFTHAEKRETKSGMDNYLDLDIYIFRLPSGIGMSNEKHSSIYSSMNT